MQIKSDQSAEKKSVSVRLQPEVIRIMDELSERTGRSRGFYMREAISAHLPLLLERHWAETILRRVTADEEMFQGLLESMGDNTAEVDVGGSS